MDEQTTNAGEMTEQQAGEMPAETQETFDPQRAMALIEKLRTENRELSKTAKRAKQLEEAEITRQQAEMTELQRAQKQLADLQAELATEKRTRLQREVAVKVGLPPVLADRLKGETAEELEADAQAVLAELPKTPAAPKVPAGPGIVPANPGANGQAGESDAARRARLGL